MDNRRMYIPRTFYPKIYTLHSSGYLADEKVLPTENEQKRYHIVAQNSFIKHGNMADKKSEEKRRIPNYSIDKYLE